MCCLVGQASRKASVHFEAPGALGWPSGRATLKFRSGGALMASFVRMGEETPVAPAPVTWQEQDWAERLEKSIERGANQLLSIQAEQGYWQGQLEADTTLQSDYIYYLYSLGKADPPRLPNLAYSL